MTKHETKKDYDAGYKAGTKARDGERGSIYYGGYGDGYGDGLKDGYKKGLKCAWEAARKIYDIQNAKMVKEIFGADANYVIHNFAASTVIEKIEMHEKFLEMEKKP